MHFHSGMGCYAVQSELRPEVSLFISSAAETKEQWERGRESGGEQIIIPGDSAHKISRKAYMFFGVGEGAFTYHLVATEDTYYPGNVQAWRACRKRRVLADVGSSYLLVVAQLVVQDDAVGLLRLRPRQGETVHGGADLVHDGNNGGSCRVGEKEQRNGATVSGE